MNKVIIVGPRYLVRDKQGGLRADNYDWAEQFVKASPGNRFLIEMNASTRDEVLRASLQAAKKAGGNGTVVYNVGHGGGVGESGVADFGPDKCFRVTEYVAFENISTGYSGESIKRQRERELVQAEAIGGAKARQRAEQRWCRVYVRGQCSRAIEAVRDRSIVQPDYEKLAAQYREHKVRQIILLSCNVGNAARFLNELSTDFQVPVGSYRLKVESKVVAGRVRMFLVGANKKPWKNSNTKIAETELPLMNQETFYLGQVRGAYSGSSRKLRAPDVDLPAPAEKRIEILH